MLHLKCGASTSSERRREAERIWRTLGHDATSNEQALRPHTDFVEGGADIIDSNGAVPERAKAVRPVDECQITTTRSEAVMVVRAEMLSVVGDWRR